MKELKRQFFYKNHIPFIVAIVGNAGIGILNLIISWFFQQLLDLAAGNETRFTFMGYVILGLCISLFLIIFFLCMIWGEPRFRRNAISQYRSFAFERISKKSSSSFKKEKAATYLSAMTNDTASIETNYLCSLLNLPLNLIFAVGSIVLMFGYNVSLTVISIIIMALPVLLTFIAGKKLPEYDKKTSAANSNFVNAVKDILNGFQVVKCFHAERAVLKLFEKLNFDVGKSAEKSAQTRQKFNAIKGTSSFFSEAAIFAIGAWMTAHGLDVTAGMIWAFLQLTGLAIDGISALPTLYMNYKAADALIEKFDEYLNANEEQTGMTAPETLHHNITIKDLCYQMDGHEVLRKINYTFRSGGCYAVVGMSGSGKSTLLNILQGSLTDYAGTVTFDNVSLADIQPDTMYNLVSVIHQEIIIFDATLKDNITMFSDFSEDDIKNAVNTSGLQNLWASRGSDYLCGENGSNLSGGERQRIAIARCLLRNTPILLSDEATASLDTATSNEINKVLLSLDGTMRIFVTHTMDETVLRQCTAVLVMNSGRLVEAGTFEELMNKKEYFYSLYNVIQ